MSDYLFYNLYKSYSMYSSSVRKPSTVSDFLKFGLSMEDYGTYMALVYKLHSECILNGCTLIKEDSTADELIKFCKIKGLISPNDYDIRKESLFSIYIDEKDYMLRHGSFVIYRNSEDFRTRLEGILSGVDFDANFWKEEYDIEFCYYNDGTVKALKQCNDLFDEMCILNNDKATKLSKYVAGDIEEYEKLLKKFEKEMNKEAITVDEHTNWLYQYYYSYEEMCSLQRLKAILNKTKNTRS